MKDLHRSFNCFGGERCVGHLVLDSRRSMSDFNVRVILDLDSRNTDGFLGRLSIAPYRIWRHYLPDSPLAPEHLLYEKARMTQPGEA